MNPNYVRKSTDKDKVRQAYLNNLKLESSNIQQNWNANQMFKSTGQTTPNALPDNRTVTEKYADLERTRVELRSEFKEITTGVIANDIVQDLLPEELRFTADQIRQIMADLKPKFASKSAPAPVVLSYIRRLMRKFETTSGVEFGLQQDTFMGIMNSPKEILDHYPTPEYLKSVQLFIKNHLDISQYGYAARQLQLLGAILPSAKELDLIATLPMGFQADVNRAISNVAEDLPTTKDLQQWVDGVIKMDSMAIPSPQMKQQFWEELQDLLDIDPSIKDNMNDVRGALKEGIRKAAEEGTSGVVEEESAMGTPGGFAAIEAPKAGETAAAAVAVGEEEEGRLFPTYDAWVSAKAFEKKKEALKIAITETGIPLIKKDSGAPIKVDMNLKARNIKIAGEEPNKKDLRKTTISQTNADEIMKAYYSPKAAAAASDEEFESAGEGSDSDESVEIPAKIGGVGFARLGKKKSIKGCGIVRSQPKKDKMSQLIERPVDEEFKKPYTPFGRHFIHKHKLNDNILQIRTTKGGAIPQIPTARISNKLSNVVKKIMRDGAPDFEDLNSLTEDDKRALNHIVKSSRLEGKVSIPKVNFSKEKQEQDRFDLLKGEIGAGNDNKGMIREFKVMLMKFVNEGRVPRRQAHEILTDLAAQGL